MPTNEMSTIQNKLKKWVTQITMMLWETSSSFYLSQNINSILNYWVEETDPLNQVHHWMNIEKRKDWRIIGSYHRAVKYVEYENEGDTKCSWCLWNDH